MIIAWKSIDIHLQEAGNAKNVIDWDQLVPPIRMSYQTSLKSQVEWKLIVIVVQQIRA